MDYTTLLAKTQDECESSCYFKRTFEVPMRRGSQIFENVEDIKEYWELELAASLYGFGSTEAKMLNFIKVKDITYIELMDAIKVNLYSLTEKVQQIYQKFPAPHQVFDEEEIDYTTKAYGLPESTLNNMMVLLNEILKQAEERLEKIDEAINRRIENTNHPELLKERLEDGYDVKIKELELSVRAYNCLKRNDIYSLEDLLAYSPSQIKAIRNIGERAADEIINKLKEIGFHYEPISTEWVEN